VDDSAPILEEFVPGSRRLYVVFGGISGGLGMPPFEFYRITRILGDSKIFVRDHAQAWYQRGLPGIGPDFQAIARHLEGRIAASGAEEVVFVGNSMGGFAALLTCGMLGFGQVLAFSPQSFVSERLRTKHRDGRWANQIDAIHASSRPSDILELRPWLNANASGIRGRVYAGQDERLDWAHARTLIGLPNLQVYGVAGVDHGLVTRLRDMGILEGILAGTDPSVVPAPA
jgi:hypothetical protein